MLDTALINHSVTNMNDDVLNEYLKSYSGIDGGNPSAGIWICGIEYGGEIDPLIEPLVPEMKHSAWTHEYKLKHPDFTTWQYHQKIAKLMVAIREWRKKTRPPIQISAWRDYINEELHVENGESFKLNLFPLSSKNVCNQKQWTETYKKHPALADKKQYYELCRGDRFKFLKEIHSRNSPKIIVGTGITFNSDFAKAFGFSNEMQPFKISGGATQRTCYRYTDGDSTLIVSPYFGGRYGLNSDNLIIDLARRIAFEDWV